MADIEKAPLNPAGEKAGRGSRIASMARSAVSSVRSGIDMGTIVYISVAVIYISMAISKFMHMHKYKTQIDSEKLDSQDLKDLTVGELNDAIVYRETDELDSGYLGYGIAYSLVGFFYLLAAFAHGRHVAHESSHQKHA